MEVINLPLSGLKLIKPDIYRDERGFFLETYQTERYWEQGIYSDPFIQDNHSRSIKGVIRGLHANLKQDKLVRCVGGIIWDVAVDIRKDSSTFGQHYGLHLYSSDCWQLYIPKGFLHGFIVLSDIADVEYKTTSYYNKNAEFIIAWNDIDLNIDWPGDGKYLLSDKDKQAKSFNEYKNSL